MKKILVLSLLLVLATGVAVAETNYSKALEEKAILGDADAMLDLSNCYRFAMGVKKDLDWANYWLECAAKAGSTKALTVLTSLGDVGTGLKDSRRRELDAIVQRDRQRLEDDNTTIDYDTYNDALVRKAQRGDARAQNDLGVCYHNGKGVKQNYSQALYWYRKSAEQDYYYAQYNLGICYYHGLGVTTDYYQAVYWYRKAANQGYADAQCNLGFCYHHGKGVTSDYSLAVYWYRKSADQGFALAQNNLGACYENGEGVTKDLNQAIEWYRKAAKNGNTTAQDNLKRLGRSW